MRRALAHGPRQQRHDLALSVFLLHHKQTTAQLVGKLHLRERVPVVGGKPPIALGYFGLGIGQAVALFHDLRHVHLRVAVTRFGGAAIPEQRQL